MVKKPEGVPYTLISSVRIQENDLTVSGNRDYSNNSSMIIHLKFWKADPLWKQLNAKIITIAIIIIRLIIIIIIIVIIIIMQT